VAQVVEFLPSKPKAPVKNSLLPKWTRKGAEKVIGDGT
jgi:hypothetical protein